MPVALTGRDRSSIPDAIAPGQGGSLSRLAQQHPQRVVQFRPPAMQGPAIGPKLLRLRNRIEATGIRHLIHATIDYSRPTKHAVGQADIGQPIPQPVRVVDQRRRGFRRANWPRSRLSSSASSRHATARTHRCRPADCRYSLVAGACAKPGWRVPRKVVNTRVDVGHRRAREAIPHNAGELIPVPPAQIRPDIEPTFRGDDVNATINAQWTRRAGAMEPTR